MCGIAGFVGAFHARLLHAMNAAIAHRGPDDADAIVLDPPTGQRSGWHIDGYPLSTSLQPVANP